MTSSSPSSPDPTQFGRGPLSGLRVVDLSWGMVGAVATMMLADYGAEVIKVERPGGDPFRQRSGYRTWGRGKRTVTLDLHRPEDVDALRDLCLTADIVLDGLGRARLDEIGLGFDEIRDVNRGVIYCVLSGSGPELDEPHLGFDILAAARFGVMAESPGHRDGPIFPSHPAVAYGTAFVAVIGVLAAVRARLVTGDGDRVDVSIRDGILAQMGMNWWSERRLSFIASKSRTGRLDMGRRRLLLERYTCSDGVIVQVHTGAAGAFARLMDALGLDGRISKPEPGVETASELTDEDLKILHDEVPAMFLERTSDEWMTHLWEHEVACLPVQAPGKVFDDDQIDHAGLIQDLTDDEYGTIRVVGPAIRFDDETIPVASRSARVEPNVDDRPVLDWSSEGLAGHAARGDELTHPLSGVRIVELSNWFASPSGNRILRDLGADVVKVEPLSGDPIRPLPDPCEGANGGKRSLAVNVKHPAGLALVERLIETADVFQHNMRPGAAERLGLDADRVVAMNHDIVYAYGPGYGSSGPKAHLQSFAPLLSGFVGLMHIAAGEDNVPHTCFGNEDYYAGLLSAVGILASLVGRERTGIGGTVETPQLHASVLVTSEHFIVGSNIESVLPMLDHEQTGWSPTYRLYQCLVGWVCVACVEPSQCDALVDVVSAGCDRSDPVALSQALQAEFYSRTAAEWTEVLRSNGVPCEVVRETAWLSEFLENDANIASGAAIEIEHPLHGRARVIGEVVHLRRRPGRRRQRSPLLGEDTRSVLEELGVGSNDLSDLYSDGVVAGPAQAPLR